jgi:Lantibiotic biosynthesis dehydratase C-term
MTRWVDGVGTLSRYLAHRQALRTLTLRVAEVADGTSTLPASGALTTWWRSIGAVPSRRVADLCAHLLCNRPGLTYTEERYVRQLAARAAADNLVRVE